MLVLFALPSAKKVEPEGIALRRSVLFQALLAVEIVLVALCVVAEDLVCCGKHKDEGCM